jgi:hypothetical protein
LALASLFVLIESDEWIWKDLEIDVDGRGCGWMWMEVDVGRKEEGSKPVGGLSTSLSSTSEARRK